MEPDAAPLVHSGMINPQKAKPARPLVDLSIMALVLVLGFIPAVQAGAQDAYDRYFVLELSGQRSGWMHESTKIEDDHIVTTSTMQFEILRGSTTIEISMESEFVETLDNTPISMRSVQQLGSIPMTTMVTFGEHELKQTSEQNGQKTTRTFPMPEGVWFTPGEADEYLRRRLEAGAETIEVRSIDPLMGINPVLLTYSDFQPGVIEVFGRNVPAIQTKVVSSAAPGIPSEEYLDERGRLLRSTTHIGGMTIVALAADKALALADLDPPEVMQSTFISPKGNIDRPRKTEQASYILSVPDGVLPELPDLPTQHFERIDKRSGRLVVTVESESAGTPPDDACREPSAMVDSADPTILELADRAVPAEDAPEPVRAEAMRRFVYDHIDEKSLGVGLASASEVARTGVGDCTEHATLLAALLRADGIPSRTVSGLVYVHEFLDQDDIFGYHMWTQGWIDDGSGPRWIDLDATLGPRTQFDATHIALSVSPLADGDDNNTMLALVPLLGRLNIEIESSE
ncbi:MAG TPA: transglutaminase domain-containing protein [Phycisphaerales bacterium]|nr:transglutaminase domain-containing protein [Phycisphaerales bacterium]